MNYIEEFKNFLQSGGRAREILETFEDFDVFVLINQSNPIEADRLNGDMLRYDLAAFTHVVAPQKYPDTREEARAMYESLIDHTLPCLDAADGDYIAEGDYRNMLHAVMPLSVVLAYHFPEYFFPNFYRYKFYEFLQLADACGFELPPMPKKEDYRGRCMYYWQLCEILHDFRLQHNLLPAELWTFIYAFAPMCVSAGFGELPAPTACWWVGRREAIDEYRDATQTHLRPKVHKGDLIVRYEAAPTKAVTSFWKVLSDVIVDPFDPHYTTTYVGEKLQTPSLTLKELQADEYFSRHPLCKHRFLSSEGYQLTEEDMKQLLRLLSAKGFDTGTVG